MEGSTQNASAEIHSSDDLRASLQKLFAGLEGSSDSVHSITTLSTTYSIKRRRLYDVINVLCSIGCCKKSSFDNIVWIGRSNVGPELGKLIQTHRLYNFEQSLGELFNTESCIGIANLTVNFLLLFFALQQNTLDLRYVSQFLSRNTPRYKTTLCKLYQISYILNIFELTARTPNVCQVVLLDPYYGTNTARFAEPSELSIMSLLKHPPPEVEWCAVFLERRRKEFKDAFEHPSSSPVIFH